MKSSGERASACAGEVCPIGSEFGQVAAAIDAAERVAGDRVGGPTDVECAAIRRLEAGLPAPAAEADWRWLARRMSRALENGWHAAPAGRLIELAR